MGNLTINSLVPIGVKGQGELPPRNMRDRIVHDYR
jgi:hypothetical protein